MVHIGERRTAANLLEQFFKGEITNDEFENDYPIRSGDAGLDVVYDRIWLYYDDVAAQSLRQEELTLQDRQLFEHCMAFLRTDFEYEGPLLNRGLSFPKRMMQLAGGLFSRGKVDSRFLSPDWPFTTPDQYRQAKPGAPS
jgi:hypothetical protein